MQKKTNKKATVECVSLWVTWYPKLHMCTKLKDKPPVFQTQRKWPNATTFPKLFKTITPFDITNFSFKNNVKTKRNNIHKLNFGKNALRIDDPSATSLSESPMKIEEL